MPRRTRSSPGRSLRRMHSLAVAPPRVVDAGEEVVAGHDQQVLRLQSLVQLLAVDRQVFRTRARGRGRLRLVDVEARMGNGLRSSWTAKVGFLLVEGFHHLFAQGDDVTASIIGMVMAGPRLPGARLMMPLRLVMARMIFSSAMTMPQRVPGRPSLERLMQRMVLAFQNGFWPR